MAVKVSYSVIQTSAKIKIKFNSDIVINYGEKNVDTTKFVSGIDDIKLKTAID